MLRKTLLTGLEGMPFVMRGGLSAGSSSFPPTIVLRYGESEKASRSPVKRTLPLSRRTCQARQASKDSRMTNPHDVVCSRQAQLDMMRDEKDGATFE